jgi:hypothetical protein
MPEISVSVEEIVSELDELGRAKWDAALARVENRKLREELARVSNERTASDADTE